MKTQARPFPGRGALAVAAVSFLFLFAAARWTRAGGAMTPDEKQIRQLNEQYIEAFLKSDAAWYRKHLADDFVCIESSGAVLDKPAFLEDAAKPISVAEYHLVDVQVRFYGDTALVQGLGAFTRKDGTAGRSRYIDVYVRIGGEWRAVSAQITRIQN